MKNMLVAILLFVIASSCSIRKIGTGIVIGDSIAYGYFHSYGIWTKKLNETSDYDWTNKGIGGNTSKNVLDRFYKDCINLQPDVVLLHVGINDIRKSTNIIQTEHEFMSNISIINQLCEKNKIKLLICEIPFVKDRDNAITIRLNNWITNIIRGEYNYCENNWNDKSRYSDGIHPTELGYIEIFDKFIKNKF